MSAASERERTLHCSSPPQPHTCRRHPLGSLRERIHTQKRRNASQKRVLTEMARQQLMGASSSSSASSNGENQALLTDSTAGLRAIIVNDDAEKKSTRGFVNSFFHQGRIVTGGFVMFAILSSLILVSFTQGYNSVVAGNNGSNGSFMAALGKKKSHSSSLGHKSHSHNVGKGNDKVEVGGRLETIFANVESLTQEFLAENADLRAQYDALQAKVDNFFQPPSPPPPPPPLTPIPDASWHTFVEECLTEAPETGECTVWASGNNYGTMPDWDVSEVTDMSGWNNGPTGFHGTMGYQGFNADITRWDTSGLKTMQAMFENTQSFQQDIGVWDTSGVTNMWATFKNSAFNRDISGWNTSSVTVMKAMFLDNTAFNQDISSWNGTAAETEQLRIFEGATAFQAKFSCTNIETGPVNSCELKST